MRQDSLPDVKETETSGILGIPPPGRPSQKRLQSTEGDTARFQLAWKASPRLPDLSRGASGGLVKCLHSGTRQQGPSSSKGTGKGSVVSAS